MEQGVRQCSQQQFAPLTDAEGKSQTSAAAKAYQWLAAEDEPGKIIVDVIRAQASKDGTQLSWQEASKRADEYLAGQYRKAYDKRQALLVAKPAAATAAPVAAAKPPAPPVAAAKPPSSEPKKWSRERDREIAKAAFRTMIAGERNRTACAQWADRIAFCQASRGHQVDPPR